MARSKRARLGYVTSRYPLISHSFIQREILGLRRAGFDIDTFSIARVDDAEILSDIDRREADQTINIRPVGPARLVRHLVRPALAHPLAVLRVLRTAAKGWWGDPKQLLWRMFYVAEAIMLWSIANKRGIVHLHAHHANVAADTSRLAAEFGKSVQSAPTSWSFTMHGSKEFTDIERHDLGVKAQEASGVVCISDFTRSQVMMVTPPAAWDSFSVVHCGIDPEVFVPAPREPDPAMFTVLFVGRLAPEKGLPLLIEALGSLQRSIAPRQVSFLVVGSGPLQADIAKQCADLGIQCEFAGAVGGDAVLGYYHRADALCMASFREGIPITLMEAMACELPCVAPHITAIPELIEHEVTGLSTTAGRSDLIAAQLLRYAQDPEFSRTIGRAGRARVVEDFSARDSIEQMSEFFRPILDEARSERA